MYIEAHGAIPPEVYDTPAQVRPIDQADLPRHWSEGNDLSIQQADGRHENTLPIKLSEAHIDFGSLVDVEAMAMSVDSEKPTLIAYGLNADGTHRFVIGTLDGDKTEIPVFPEDSKTAIEASRLYPSKGGLFGLKIGGMSCHPTNTLIYRHDPETKTAKRIFTSSVELAATNGEGVFYGFDGYRSGTSANRLYVIDATDPTHVTQKPESIRLDIQLPEGHSSSERRNVMQRVGDNLIVTTHIDAIPDGGTYYDAISLIDVKIYSIAGADSLSPRLLDTVQIHNTSSFFYSIDYQPSGSIIAITYDLHTDLATLDYIPPGGAKRQRIIYDTYNSDYSNLISIPGENGPVYLVINEDRILFFSLIGNQIQGRNALLRGGYKPQSGLFHFIPYDENTILGIDVAIARDTKLRAIDLHYPQDTLFLPVIQNWERFPPPPGIVPDNQSQAGKDDIAQRKKGAALKASRLSTRPSAFRKN